MDTTYNSTRSTDASRPDAPGRHAPRADAPDAPDAPGRHADAPRADAPRADAPRADAPRADTTRADAPTDRPPRSFYPDYIDTPPADHGAPGWQLGLERRVDDGRTLARGMALFSVGLGLVEVLAPRKVTRFLGVDARHANLVRLYGLREIASGIGIYSQRTPTTAVWSRVAGDVLDMATLSLAFRSDNRKTSRLLMAMGAVAGAAAADVTSALQLQRLPSKHGRAEARPS